MILLICLLYVDFWAYVNSLCRVRNAEAPVRTDVKPGTILDMNGEPLEYIDMPLSSDHINGKIFPSLMSSELK